MSTQSKLHFGEAWLLETGALHTVPLFRLSMSADEMHEWLLRGHHGLSRQELIRSLRRLFDEGNIEAAVGEKSLGSVPTDVQLTEGLQGSNRDLCYRVTAKGGDRWESLAKPQWERFFEFSYLEDEHGEVIAGSPERLEEILANSVTFLDMVIDEGSPQQNHEVAPWRPLHWKLLPVGYSARVRWHRYSGDKHDLSVMRRQASRRFQRWQDLYHWTDSICGLAVIRC